MRIQRGETEGSRETVRVQYAKLLSERERERDELQSHRTVAESGESRVDSSMCWSSLNSFREGEEKVPPFEGKSTGQSNYLPWQREALGLH